MFTLKTPEFLDGRKVVVVANDIAYKIGSFGPIEDQFFYLVTCIGLAEEVINLFSCAWNDEAHPEKGFEYLYLTWENYLKVQAKAAATIRTMEVEAGGEVRYKIMDIIGLQDGLGVEPLKGPGLIA